MSRDGALTPRSWALGEKIVPPAGPGASQRAWEGGGVLVVLKNPRRPAPVEPGPGRSRVRPERGAVPVSHAGPVVDELLVDHALDVVKELADELRVLGHQEVEQGPERVVVSRLQPPEALDAHRSRQGDGLTLLHQDASGPVPAGLGDLDGRDPLAAVEGVVLGIDTAFEPVAESRDARAVWAWAEISLERC